MPGPIRNPTEAFQQLEAIMLRQMLQSSGAFRASSTPGAQLRTDLFVETLADAVAKAGGLGIAHMLERQMGVNASDGKPTLNPGSFALHRPSAGAAGAVGTLDAVNGGTDSIDDPNSQAPLPEDPAAPSIDDYQTVAKGTGSRLGGGQPAAAIGRPLRATHPHLHLPKTTHDHPLDPTSIVLPTSVTRALNRYRQRVEDTGAGTPSGAGSGGKP